ncbi:MAG: hypothetical protein IKZ39_04840, partial [Lachnospiraceae bacterium]|nr:hypothetical protein [Lachnospiraceae bacterium]
MKKKNTVFIIIYMLLLTAPSLSMPFFFNGKNSEKRELASFPALYAEGKINADFSEQLNDFFNDRIGFRSYLVGANTVVRKNLFGQSAVEKVIIGKKGWLFFNDTLSDYQRTDLLSERNINNAVRTVEMMNEYLIDRDIAFVFTIIPNKNTLYPEYMKSGYKRNSASSDMERIAEKIKHTDVAYADVYNAIKAYDRVLYQRTDSHWTYEGALVGYRCIMDSSETDYNHFDSVSFERRKDWDSDLGEMLYS